MNPPYDQSDPLDPARGCWSLVAFWLAVAVLVVLAVWGRDVFGWATGG